MPFRIWISINFGEMAQLKDIMAELRGDVCAWQKKLCGATGGTTRQNALQVGKSLFLAD